ncbi:MAG: histidine kinase dimerization/phosphoacceptor domain -containing protein [Sediminicola sp.]
MVSCFLLGHGQDVPDHEIRELRRQMKKQRSDATGPSVDLQLQLGMAYLKRHNDYQESTDSATYFLKRSLTAAKAMGDPSRIKEIQVGLCEVYYRNRDTANGKACFLDLIDRYRAEGNIVKEGKVWSRMGETIWGTNMGNQAVYEEVLKYYDKAIIAFKRTNSTQEETDVRRNIADVHLNQGKLDQAESELKNVLRAYGKLNYNRLHPTYFLLTVTNRLQGDLDTALFYGMKTIENVKETNDTYQTSVYLSVIGDIYRELEDHAESIKWYKRAVHEWEINGLIGHGNVYRYLNYMGREMAQVGEASTALELLNAFEIRFPPVELQQKALLEGTKAYVHTILDEHQKAERHYAQMLQWYEKMGNSPYQIYVSEAYQELGSFYLHTGAFEKARYYLLKALDFPEGITSFAKKREINLLLFKTDSASGNLLSAMEYYKKHKELSDLIFNEKKSRQISELQIKYKTAQKESDIKILTKEKALRDNKLERNKIAKNYMIGGFVLMLMVIGLLLNSYLHKQKNTRILISQKNEIHQKNSVLQNLLAEKEWLLKEVHHRVKNNLQIVMSLLNVQTDYMESPEALLAIRNSQHRLFAISLIHQKLYKSNDMNLIEMQPYLKDLVEYLTDSYDIQGRISFVTWVPF